MPQTGFRVEPLNSSVNVGVTQRAVSTLLLLTALRPLNFWAVVR